LESEDCSAKEIKEPADHPFATLRISQQQIEAITPGLKETGAGILKF
jgi:hypothetical protein